ncbi:MAG: hypothetical protein F8N37_07200 [Telmatospirillum sp.]|nr:hypothetical protein [Telmatospirillum sp.]
MCHVDCSSCRRVL